MAKWSEDCCPMKGFEFKCQKSLKKVLYFFLWLFQDENEKKKFLDEVNYTFIFPYLPMKALTSYYM